MCSEQHKRHDFPNSHLLTQAFDYCRPDSVETTVAILGELGERVKLLAGGTNVLVDLKMDPGEEGPEVLVDVSRIPGLRGIEREDEWTRIGALTSIRAIAVDETIWTNQTALAEACAAFGSTQVATMGTIGGNVANGSPASDTVPALVVFGALAVLSGPEGEREALVADLLRGPGDTAIGADELLTEVRLPEPPAQCGSAFLKLSRVKADLAKVSVAVRVVYDGDRIIDARIALGSVGPTVVRAKRASEYLIDKTSGHEHLLEAARLASEEIRPIDDVRSTAAYRTQAAMALVYDALSLAVARAGMVDVSRPIRGVVAEPMLGLIEPSVLEDEDDEEEPDILYVEADERTSIELSVNGQPYAVDVAPGDLLLNVLRERFELTGTKYGCGIGECGACTVWMNGAPVLGCLVLAVGADGAEIRTVEGLAGPGGALDPLQEAFIEENAFQCGYCTPGMLLMTRKLLEEIPDPTEDEIVDYLKGNHCRCTGYASIVRAVHRVARGSES